MTKPRHRLTSVDNSNMTGTCAICGPGVAIVIRKRRPKPGDPVVVSYACKTKYYGSITSAPSAGTNRNSHGLTVVEARAFLAGKVCEACGTDEDLNVDHCHKRNKVRGPLCGRCNRALGLLFDDPVRLRNLADYVERHSVSQDTETEVDEQLVPE